MKYGNTTKQKMLDISMPVLQYIHEAMPMNNTAEGTVCGRTLVGDREFAFSDPPLSCSVPSCSSGILSYELVRPLVQGFVLVTPDTPLVRQLMAGLDEVFRHGNYLRDLLLDMQAVSDQLQDALNNSDLPLAVQVG